MENSLKELVVLLRTMQLFYHNCHNVCFGATFLSDHNLFADFYGQIEDDYDSVAERLIGLYGKQHLSLKEIMEKVEDLVEELQEPNKAAVEGMLAQGGLLEFRLKSTIDMLCKSTELSEGSRNLLAQVADNAEMRIYKIRQRMTNE